MILHSLNAVRVIIEYIIVNLHVNDLGSENLFPGSYGSSNSLMSFFFVLSGFVAMHTTDGLDKTYIMRRLKKTYPFYLLMWLCGFPAVYYGNTQVSKCPTSSWIYTALQPFCVQIFLMWRIEGSNIPGWYYSVLIFLWVAHSYIDLKHYIMKHPLKYMVLFYVTSVTLSVPCFYFDRESVKQQPIFRILEFWMGASAAISVRNGYEIRGEIALLFFISYIVYASFTVIRRDIWSDNVQKDSCNFWVVDGEFKFKANGLNTVTSILWATIIHWLAGSEIRGDNNIFMRMLCLDVFKSMAKFSLQLYLSHWVTTQYFRCILEQLGILDWFSKDVHMIWAYVTSYALYVFVQPILDRWFIKKTEEAPKQTARV